MRMFWQLLYLNGLSIKEVGNKYKLSIALKQYIFFEQGWEAIEMNLFPMKKPSVAVISFGGSELRPAEIVNRSPPTNAPWAVFRIELKRRTENYGGRKWKLVALRQVDEGTNFALLGHDKLSGKFYTARTLLIRKVVVVRLGFLSALLPFITYFKGEKQNTNKGSTSTSSGSKYPEEFQNGEGIVHTPHGKKQNGCNHEWSNVPILLLEKPSECFIKPGFPNENKWRTDFIDESVNRFFLSK